MNRTCDECKYYSIVSGVCVKFTIMRHSCGEDACPEFVEDSMVSFLKGFEDGKDFAAAGQAYLDFMSSGEKAIPIEEVAEEYGIKGD